MRYLVKVRGHVRHDLALVADHAAIGRRAAAFLVADALGARQEARVAVGAVGPRVLERRVNPPHHARQNVVAHVVRAASGGVEHLLLGEMVGTRLPRIGDAGGPVFVARVHQVGVAVEVLVDYK